MANFYDCVSKSLKYEKGYFEYSDEKVSNYGLSLKFAQNSSDFEIFDTNNDFEITKEDIKNLTFEKALLAYKKYYWDVFGLDEFSSNKKAFLIFDAAVNHGVKIATVLIQKAINLIDGFTLEEDGVYGPKTKKAITDCSVEDFVHFFQIKRKDLYEAIVRDNPQREGCLVGWLKRLKETENDLNFFKD